MAEYKIQLGVKLNTSEIRSQVSKYNGNSNNAKLKLGVKLDTKGISDQIRAINSRTPVRVDLRLNTRNAQTQINNIRRQIEQLGNIRINLGGTGGSGGRNGRNVINDTYRAYQELISLQNRIGSKQQAVARLDTTRNQQEITGLTSQIDNLYNRYQRLYNLFSRNFSVEQLDNLNRNFQITGENLDIINRRLADTSAVQRARTEIQSLENELAELRNIATQMGRLETEIFKLDTSANANEIRELESQLNSLRTTYDRLMSNFNFNNPNLNIGQLQELDAIFARTENRIAQLNARMADTSAVRSQTQAYKELLSISKQIGNLESTIKKLKGQGGNTNQIAELERQLRELKATYIQVSNAMEMPLSGDQWNTINNQIMQTQNKLAQLDAEIADAKEKAASGIKLKIEDGTFDNNISDIESKFNKLSNKSTELRTGINNVKQALASMKTAAANGDINALIDAEERYKRALKDVENQLKINARTERDAANLTSLNQAKERLSLDMGNWLKNNSAAAKQFGGRIKELQAQISSCDKTSLAHLRNEFNNIKKQAELTGKATQTLGDKIRAQFSKYSAYLSVASVFMYTTQAMRDMFNQVVAIDSAMTELKKVTDETDSSYNKFLTNAASRAKEIGTTIDGLVSSTADFARLGYNFKDSQGLAEVANIYAVVGDEVEGVEGATESLISTMAAFKDEASDISNTDFATSIIDKFNEIGNKFAISSGGIGEAMKRSASSLDAANNSIDESIALITAANTVVQNPDKVGRLLPTIKVAISVKLQRWTRPSKDFVYNF